MRSLGEEAYRVWHVKHILQTPLALYLSCLAGESFSVATVGAVIILFSDSLVLLSVGWGIVGYGFAITYFVLLARWRLQCVASRDARHAAMETAALVSVGLPESPHQK
jgi:hypothetical protein